VVEEERFSFFTVEFGPAEAFPKST